ncbi:MAG: bifunctional adenosylcobinamide kinase/adenosylcobinamide-phosphate guanylyltransferase [Burkholderia sp.]|nr:MAG: Bifunctional adenosylcobalamin biosynthesis protein CobP [Burkholderia gladioli]
MTSHHLNFVFGGTRSGKSAYAERLAAASGRAVTYVATARVVGDAAFDRRIAHHQARRPPDWRLVEAPEALAEAVAALDHPAACVLVDCLTLWLAGLLCPPDGTAVDAATLAAHVAALEDVLRAPQARVIVVSNEIGLGVIPLGTETRRYVDELGRLNQRIAALATHVTLVVAGLPMSVKVPGEPEC